MAAGGAIERMKEIGVNSRWNRADLADISPLAPDEIGGLAWIPGNDAVSEPDELALDLRALGGFVQMLLGDSVFHVRRGVEHKRKGNRQIALHQLRNPAREPIMRVDNVIADAVSQREKRHFGSKVRKILEELVFA